MSNTNFFNFQFQSRRRATQLDNNLLAEITVPYDYQNENLNETGKKTLQLSAMHYYFKCVMGVSCCFLPPFISVPKWQQTENTCMYTGEDWFKCN
jgi:hypothetical protein